MLLNKTRYTPQLQPTDWRTIKDLIYWFKHQIQSVVGGRNTKYHTCKKLIIIKRGKFTISTVRNAQLVKIVCRGLCNHTGFVYYHLLIGLLTWSGRSLLAIQGDFGLNKWLWISYILVDILWITGTIVVKMSRFIPTGDIWNGLIWNEYA